MLGGRSEEDASHHEGTSRIDKEVREKVHAYGDTKFINDALYQNYLTMFRFYDDDFEQAADFMECLSLNQTQEDYIGRTQDYSLRAFAHMPSLSFKARSQRHHDFS